MPRDFTRSRRVEDQIQRILSDVIRVHVRDPRLHNVVITAVDVSRDIGVAWVHYTSLDPDRNKPDLQAAIESAAGFMRSQLASALSVRHVPELRFRFDDTSERSQAMDDLIDSAVASNKQPDDDSQEGQD